MVLLLFIYSVNIKPPRHHFGFSLCMGLAIAIIFFSADNLWMHNLKKNSEEQLDNTSVLINPNLCIILLRLQYTDYLADGIWNGNTGGGRGWENVIFFLV